MMKISAPKSHTKFPSATTAKRILVVDDNPSIHKDFEKILLQSNDDLELLASESELFGIANFQVEETDYDVDHAYQGVEGLEMVVQAEREERPYDLAFVDMRMPPGWDGLETISRLWQVDPDLQVVICTAYSDYSWRDITNRLNSSDNLLILKKPFDNVEVCQMAATLTKKMELIRERNHYTQILETQVREQTLTTRRAHEETIHRLVNASMYRDTETGAHITRVGKYSALLARLAGWAPSDVEQIRMAAPMHDVGKIGIRDDILLKPGRLTPEERQIMEQHTIIGHELLQGSESRMLQMAGEIALNHHENWNGSGYPHGKSGTNIPEMARIVSIIDVHDALSHDRVYRPAFAPDKILEIMTSDIGVKFDPKLAELFFQNIRMFDDNRSEF